MKYLYLISQDTNNGYDTYDSAVVCARNEEEARNYPVGDYGRDFGNDWVSPEKVKVELIGEATKNIKVGAILKSFNAG